MFTFKRSKKKVLSPLEVFLTGKMEMNEQECLIVIHNSIGDFKIVRDEPQYLGGFHPTHRDLIVQYNGCLFKVSGYKEGKEVHLSAPIESIGLWALGRPSPYMISTS
jgi:hypothetical protein